jgi:hypothetical protein
MKRLQGRVSSELNSVSYRETIARDSARALARAFSRDRSTPAALVGPMLVVSATVLALWLGTGVRIDEIVRFVPYELGYVFLPGWCVYRALVRDVSRLRQIVLGWSLGYLLEIFGFFVTAQLDVRALFYAYPVLVLTPVGFLAWLRRRRSTTESAAPTAQRSRSLSPAPIWAGAALCVFLLLYTAIVAYTQNPMPRQLGSATYQEDTVFTISIAAEALHHWPVTLPMVAGQPLHYHLFAYMHMAAVSQVTGIDLSVVIMRLYEVPLLLLFALQLFLAGKRIGRSSLVGLVAVALVFFFGELDAAWTGARFLFGDYFFYWLLSSHTFLLGLVFFMPALLILSDLVTPGAVPRQSRASRWVLVALFFVGCVGAKSYGLVVLGAGLGVFLLLQVCRERRLSRPGLLALAIFGGVDTIANVLVFKWSAGGAHAAPWRTVEKMYGAEEVVSYLKPLWGLGHTPSALAVPYATFGLLGIPLVGIGLFARYKRRRLMPAEALFLSVFIVALPPLFLLNQSGFSQLFLVFFGVVPGLIVAASGYTLFWKSQTRHSLAVGAATLLVAGGATLIVGTVLEVPRTLQLELTLFWLVIVTAVASFRRAPGLVATAATLGAVGVLLIVTPLWRMAHFPAWRTAVAIVVAVAAIAIVVQLLRRSGSTLGLTTSVVVGCLVFGLLNTPLDWLPHLVKRAEASEPLYDTQYRGLTGGLYQGLHWVRAHTRANDVLAVSNHSLYPDNHDSKYFYYSAFAERRVVLESWDYTAQAAASGLFSLDAAHTPFFRRLTLSNLAFGVGDQNALRALARDYSVDYLIVDKVHRSASPILAEKVKQVYSNGDIDVYSVGRFGPAQARDKQSCISEQGAGVVAVFGHRRVLGAAIALRNAAEGVGFPGLAIQQRGCDDYAVVLTGFDDLTQARQFQRQAATRSFPVRLECRTTAPHAGLNAVFGHRRSRSAAERLKASAEDVGFRGLDVQQDKCGDWEVDLRGLKTESQRRDFRSEAARVGFRVRFEPG